jgi:hypothetical protein
MGGQPADYFAEHSTRKIAISLAAFSAAASGLPLFLLAERPSEHALSGFLTHFRRGWCPNQFCSCGRSLHGVLAIQNQPLEWVAKVANPVAHGGRNIHGIRRSAVALFCASLRGVPTGSSSA